MALEKESGSQVTADVSTQDRRGSGARLAHGAIALRPLTRHEDFARCVELQVEIWGYEAGDLITRKVFMLASRIGGQVIGALDGEKLIGFAMALPGFRDGHPYLHSHMLAVLPAYRNGGVGRRLKLAQREDALARGFELMEWTFDPLEIKNAYLNIHRLGAVVRRYEHDFYGSSSSPLQGGLPTDRIYAEWWLRSPRVERALAGRDSVQGPVIERVGIPAAIYSWKASDQHRETARSVQQHTAQALESGFARGLTVIGYERSVFGDGSFLLGRWDGPYTHEEETK